MNTEQNNDPLENTPPVIGSGNFLVDRGYVDPDEARVKFQLANKIALLVENRGLRQTDVCELTGLKQPDVSRIVNGNVGGYSVWRLMTVLKSLGQRVTIAVEAADEDETEHSLAVSV